MVERLGSTNDDLEVEVIQSTIKVERRRRSRLGQLSGIVSVGIVGGISLYGAIELINNTINHFDERYEPVKRERGVESLDSYYEALYGPITSEKKKELAILNYSVARVGFIDFVDYQLKTDYSDETKKFISQERYDLVVDGITILQNYLGLSDIKLDQENFLVEIPGLRDFDLKNDWDMVLLDGIITNVININDKGFPLEERYRAKMNYTDLAYLANSKLKVEMESEAWGFPDNDVLMNIARTYKVHEELGYKFPEKVGIILYTARHRESGFYVPNEVYVTSEGGFSITIHEEAHHQADVNKEFSQKKYDEFIDRVSKDALDSGIPVCITCPFVTDYPLSKNGHSREVEDYAVTIQHYFSDGVEFRRKLKDSELSGSADYIILKAKYDFAKMYFGGREFVENGEGFNPKVGDVYKINDPEGEKRGIGLRLEPNLKAPSNAIVHDMDEVLVNQGPIEYFDEASKTTKKLWLVKRGYYESSSGVFDRLREDDEVGWISEEWFGKIIKHAESEQYGNNP